jgi:hypothetical protein
MLFGRRISEAFEQLTSSSRVKLGGVVWVMFLLLRSLPCG